MKNALTLLLVCFLASCNQPVAVENDPNPVASVAPSFNQVNVGFRSSHVTCLLNQWYGLTYKNEPIVFRVINDERAYQAFFSCTTTTPLPAIDFSKNTLLIGMKADYGQFMNTPTSISSISQVLVSTNGSNYTLKVKVVGEANKNAPGKGGEWFAFTSVVPKITSTVNLDMQYQFK